MKKKDFIYYASAALLLAVSVQPAYADEQESAVQPIQVKAEQAQDTVAKTASDASEKVESKGEARTDRQEEQENSQAEQNTESSQSVPASLPKQSQTKVENQSASIEETAQREEASKVDEVASKKGAVGNTTFYSAGHAGPASRSSDVAVQPKTFVDVSSHGSISVNDYRTLANKGVGGVVVKLTEGTTYRNPYAGEQARNAQSAGLQVSAYAFSHYTSEEQARAEARHFISEARNLNLPKNTVMVNDMEDAKMKDNINRNTLAWADEMRKNGYTNLMYYTSASWIDENNLRGKGPVKTAQFGLENFWVAQYPTAKLSANDAKTLRYNGRAGAWQFTSQAELLPGKHVFDHSVDYTGRFTSQAKPVPEVAKGPLSGKISIENNDSLAGRFDVVISNVLAPQGVASVSVPVWSDDKGQDDLIWHHATRQQDGRYRVTVKASDHNNSTGKYHVHLYYTQLNGEQIGVTATTTEVSIGKTVNKGKPSGRVTIENNNSTTGTFDAVIRDVVSPNGLKEVLVPTWSEVNGQDDLVWHKAVKQADGSYRATIKSSEHKNSQGKYQVHVHYIDGSGQRRYVTETVTEVHQSRPSGVLSIENQNQISGTFDAVVRNVIAPNGLKEVLIPTWSEVNGQDDLVWHKAVKQADGSYRATIKSSDHKNSQGKYQVHVHYVDGSGQRRYVTETSTQLKLSQPTGKVNIQNNNKETGTFDVVVTDVFSPKGVQAVQVPVWSDQGGQDDLIWYSATRQSDGSYKASIKAENHKNSTGTYHVHLYYIQNDGSRIGVHSTTTQVEYRNLTHKTKAYIKDVNSQTGTFTVAVDQSAQGKRIKNIRAAVWSQAHQENLSWYTQTPAGGHTEIGIAAVNHGNKQGDYTTHVYVDYTDGSVEGFNLGQTRLIPQQVTDQKNRVIRAAANLVGTSTGSAAHQRMVADYNSVKPLPVGYAVKNTDDWCDVFVTVVFQREGLSYLVGRECGVERHIQIFKKLGIWNEDGTTTPQSGDIITFNWDKDTQQNDGWADHIGIVERVENGWIHTIEGNSSNGVVRRNTYRVGHGNIRGFARPHYQ